MRNRLHLLSLLTLALTGISCNSSLEQFNTDYSQTLLQINGSINGAVTRAYNNQWEQGDAIGVSVMDANGVVAGYENYKYTTIDGNGLFKHDGKAILFPAGGSNTLRAYYPYGEISNHLYTIDLSNQSHQPTIDLMTAQSQDIQKGNSNVSMQFSHRLSKLEISIEGVSTDKKIGVKIERQKANLKYSLQDDRITVGDSEQSILFCQTENKAEAILAPNTLEGNAPVDRRLTITVDGKSYSAAILSATSFQPGYRYRYSFRLNADGTATIKGTDIADWELVGEDEIGNVHTFKQAPLYWSVYEYCWLMSKTGIAENQMDMNEDEWDKAIEWVAANLKPYGYDMLCTDGFIPMLCAENEHGYMDKYGSMYLKDIVAKCKAKGLKLGVYDNPLWLHGTDGTPIQNTNNITQGQLRYNAATDKVIYQNEPDKFFTYAVATHQGAKEYIDGFFKHYKELGVEYIRMDFLSWYEDGFDRGMQTVGRGYGTECYKLALQYIAQAAKKYGIFTSLVMPHLKNDAQWEKKYGNMVRIVADTGDGGWHHCSDADRGKAYEGWPNCMNMYDGFVHWSKISGRGKVFLDGDFIRLNTFATDDEKRAVISLQLMAGGPVTVADQHNTIGDNLKFYQNEEVLALNKDGFVGKPLDTTLTNTDDRKNQIWYGQMSNGDWIVCIFNREGATERRYVDLKWFGLENNWKIRDMWTHTDEGENWKIEANIPAHGCKMVRLSR